MATDERNFRASYYDKVGFRSVEEKKSLEILLKDKPLDKIKLKQFCLRFSVPGVYRNVLWKLLLGVSPRFADNLEFVSDQRTQVYKTLQHALEVMGLVNDSTTKPQLFLLMWLLETGELKFDLETQLDDHMFKGFLAFSEEVRNIFEDDVDGYWVSKGLYCQVQVFREHIPKLVEATKSLLEKEDKAVYSRLVESHAFDLLRIDRWFLSLFAGLLHEIAVVKIWDKIIGGSYKILIFVAVVIFTTHRRNILNVDSNRSLMEELSCMSEQTSEVVGNKGIELWQQYGAPLAMGDSRKDKAEHS